MNPWLEKPLLWRDVHHRLITALAEALAPQLRPRYFIAVETHVYVAPTPGSPEAQRYPDVMVINRGGPAVAASAQPTSPYVTVPLDIPEPLEEGFLEVRLVPTGEVVTVIEVLSYSNKDSDRQTYLKKRAQLLETQVHFVEIDLLRGGEPMPYALPAEPHHYRLFIRRSERPFEARVYPFSVRQPIPTFTLPLRPDDAEPVVDLGALLQQIYDRAGYDLVLDYARQPTPLLSEADLAWAQALVNT